MCIRREVTIDEPERRELIANLDDKLLVGGATMSEWAAMIVLEADFAFVAGANLASIITAMAGIETYLRAEYGNGRRTALYDLVEASPLNPELKRDIHDMRAFRNRWVHLSDSADDQAVLEHPEKYERELEDRARSAIRLLRRTIYENQWL